MVYLITPSHKSYMYVWRQDRADENGMHIYRFYWKSLWKNGTAFDALL